MKGQKTGGKKVGSKNKVTVAKELIYNNLWDEVANKITSEGIQKCWREMDSLTGKDYVNAFMGMLEYFRPKLQRNTHEGSIDANISTATFTFEEAYLLKYGRKPDTGKD